MLTTESTAQRKSPTTTKEQPKNSSTSQRHQTKAKKNPRSSSTLKNSLLFLAGLLALASAISFIVTDSFTFGYKLPGNLTKWRSLVKEKKGIVLTEKQLARYDGSDPTKPIYIAISGEVYDVTAGRSYYGPTGSYKFFAGRDAARAYVTGCFDTHLTHDLRGFTEAQIKEVDGWMEFYENHDKYFWVGHVMHPAIDPDSPIPEMCKK